MLTQKIPKITLDASTIQRARINAGLTYEQMARRIGVSTSTVFRWERGTPPKGQLVREELMEFVKRYSIA
jgi:transcriptional regulator with XRE-family HTH domain